MCFRNRRGGEYVDPAATLSAACARDAIPNIRSDCSGSPPLLRADQAEKWDASRLSRAADEPTLRVLCRSIGHDVCGKIEVFTQRRDERFGTTAARPQHHIGRLVDHPFPGVQHEDEMPTVMLVNSRKAKFALIRSDREPHIAGD